MSDLMADLKAVKPRKPNLAEWLLSRTPDERKAFDAAVIGGAPASKMVDLVRKHGGATTVDSIEKYRARAVSR